MQFSLFEGSLSGMSRLQLLDEDDETPALLHMYTDRGARISVKVESTQGCWTLGWLHQSQAIALHALVRLGAIMPVRLQLLSAVLVIAKVIRYRRQPHVTEMQARGLARKSISLR